MDTQADEIVAHLTKRLAAVSVNLPQDFRDAAREVAPLMSPSHFRLWAEDGVALAEQSLRSWEAAGEYFRASPRVVAILPFEELQRWSATGRRLVDQSSLIAASYFRASPDCLRLLPPGGIEEWAAIGERLHQGNWKSVNLAAQLFSLSPQLFNSLDLAELRALQDVLTRLAEHSYELAAACLEAGPVLLGQLERGDRRDFLLLTEAIAVNNWAEARHLFEQGAELVNRIHPQERRRFMRLAAVIAGQAGQRTYQLFFEAAEGMGAVDGETHGELLSLAEELAPTSPAAAMEFLKNAP